MEYTDLESTLIGDNRRSHQQRNQMKSFCTVKLIHIASYISLLLIFLISFGFNIFRPQCAPSLKVNFDEPRIQNLPKEQFIQKNGSTIYCNREFFLFHKDHNHVCEVTGVVIKEHTNVTVIGNPKINVLSIFNFEIYKLPKEIFQKFINLKHLIVNGNHMQVLEADTFDFAENLELLRLSNNDLTKLESFIFRKLHNLKTLDLGRNKISTMAYQTFDGLMNLERLYLSDNNLKALPSGVFFPLKKLASISLENNQISHLDDDVFGQNRQVRSVGLSNNTFRDIQNEIFRHFENLTDLSISDLRVNSLNLNGTTLQTLVIRNTDIVNVTLCNFPKILVSYGTNIEFMQFVIDEATADFKKIPNWGGIFYNLHIRFLFFFKKEIATQQNIEAYDGAVREHTYLPLLNYKTVDGSEFVAVEYNAKNETFF